MRRFRIAFAPEDEDGRSRRLRAAGVKPAVGGPILVVEDDREMAQFLVHLLTERFFHVVTAENGLEALELLRRHRPCLVILDLALPLLDGPEFVRAAQGDPEFPAVPIICVSGLTDAHQIAKRLGLPCMMKPINPEALLEAVERGCQLR